MFWDLFWDQFGIYFGIYFGISLGNIFHQFGSRWPTPKDDLWDAGMGQNYMP